MRRPIVAIVGASGFIGSALAGGMADDGRVKRVKAPRLKLQGHTLAEIEALADFRATSKFANEHLADVDILINAAGLADATSADLSSLMGANAALPYFLARAAGLAGVQRFVHVSSSVVQGRRVLDESETLNPRSRYGFSKAFGEVALRNCAMRPFETVDTVIYRPTSVHGPTREVTKRLVRLASSPASAVAAPGDDPTPQMPIGRLVLATRILADPAIRPPHIVLHPWEGLTTRGFMACLGGRQPRLIPRSSARAILNGANLGSKMHPVLLGQARRIEMLMFGQKQLPGWLDALLPPAGGHAWVMDLARDARVSLEGTVPHEGSGF